jgi:outer membrane lipopolysaccharide assembly protein LptE/RlpB
MDESEERTLTVSATNTPQEYEVYYRVVWSFNEGNKTILESVTNLRIQDYTFDQRQLLGKSNESLMIKQALAKDIAQEIIFRLNKEEF